MDVRIGRGMTVIATPIRPKIGLMVTSALANDSQAFDLAHREAIALAYQMEGQDDPEGYVRRAYMARHPLIRVFQTRPSDTEVGMLLRRMPQRASQDVSAAVNLFNRYAERIGASPFTGKKRTVSKSSIPSIFRWGNAPSWDNMLSGTF